MATRSQGAGPEPAEPVGDRVNALVHRDASLLQPFSLPLPALSGGAEHVVRLDVLRYQRFERRRSCPIMVRAILLERLVESFETLFAGLDLRRLEVRLRARCGLSRA